MDITNPHRNIWGRQIIIKATVQFRHRQRDCSLEGELEYPNRTRGFDDIYREYQRIWSSLRIIPRQSIKPLK